MKKNKARMSGQGLGPQLSEGLVSWCSESAWTSITKYHGLVGLDCICFSWLQTLEHAKSRFQAVWFLVRVSSRSSDGHFLPVSP